MNQPWKNEPNKLEFKSNGFDCLIVRNDLGALCGYVGVKKDHPYFEKHYDDVTRANEDINVHGGLTYSDKCQGRICHETTERDEVWWLGFDCAHAWDYIPWGEHHAFRLLADLFPDGKKGRHTTYKDIPFVKKEIKKLAKQLKKVYV